MTFTFFHRLPATTTDFSSLPSALSGLGMSTALRLSISIAQSSSQTAPTVPFPLKAVQQRVNWLASAIKSVLMLVPVRPKLLYNFRSGCSNNLTDSASYSFITSQYLTILSIAYCFFASILWLLYFRVRRDCQKTGVEGQSCAWLKRLKDFKTVQSGKACSLRSRLQLSQARRSPTNTVATFAQHQSQGSELTWEQNLQYFQELCAQRMCNGEASFICFSILQRVLMYQVIARRPEQTAATNGPYKTLPKHRTRASALQSYQQLLLRREKEWVRVDTKYNLKMNSYRDAFALKVKSLQRPKGLLEKATQINYQPVVSAKICNEEVNQPEKAPQPTASKDKYQSNEQIVQRLSKLSNQKKQIQKMMSELKQLQGRSESQNIDLNSLELTPRSIPTRFYLKTEKKGAESQTQTKKAEGYVIGKFNLSKIHLESRIGYR